MKKDIKNALNEKMQVKLPETLNKENILSELENTENNIIEMPKKKNMAKKQHQFYYIQQMIKNHKETLKISTVQQKNFP
jgi:hypothetical protein